MYNVYDPLTGILEYNSKSDSPSSPFVIQWSKYKKVPLLMIETPDGQTVQLNDSSQIISVLKTFIDHKAELSIDQLLKYYPHFEDEQKGWLGTKSTFDFPNKYFVMYFDEPADGMKYSWTPQ